MSNTSVDIMHLVVEKFSNEVSSKMLSINIILSEPSKHYNPVDTIASLVSELADAERKLDVAKNLYTQALRMRLEAITPNDVLDSDGKDEEES